jgi:hypothetical protein
MNSNLTGQAKASDTVAAKSPDMPIRCARTSQVRQTSSIFIVGLAFLLLGMAGSALAGEYQLLGGKRVGGAHALAEDFHDWEEIQRIWRETPDFASLQREFDACRAAYEPWRASYLEHEYDALEALKTHPQRTAIERCYDMQLAYEHWDAYVYRRWKGAFRGTDVCSKTFEEDVESVRGQVCDLPRFSGYLDCATYPDWRTDEQKAEDRARDARFAAMDGDELSMSRKVRREKCREERAREAAEASAGSPL